MTRDEFARKICYLVESESPIPLNEMESKKCNTKEYKNGLYFLYDKNNICIYIGKVGSGFYTSLRKRLVGHGSGAHKRRDSRWYGQIAYGKWHQFDNIKDSDLKVLERLAIFAMKQPIYNDIDTDQQTINNIQTLL